MKELSAISFQQELVVQRNEDEGCHSEPEHRGGEESRV